MGSSRLYGKIMAKVDSEHIVFDYLINQLKHSKFIEKIIIATTTKKEDDLVVEFAKKNQIEFFRGSESDVLDRYYQCAKFFSSDKRSLNHNAWNCFPDKGPSLKDKIL